MVITVLVELGVGNDLGHLSEGLLSNRTQVGMTSVSCDMMP